MNEDGSVSLAWTAPDEHYPITGYQILRLIPDTGGMDLDTYLVFDTGSAATDCGAADSSHGLDC